MGSAPFVRSAFLILFVLLSVLVSAEPVRFVLVHTSDMHGHMAAVPDPLSQEKKRPLVGGFAVLKTFIDGVRRDAFFSGAMPLVLDSGDWFQGTPIVDETRGSCMIDLITTMRYAAVALGNHDFDYGIGRLQEMMGQARYPILCCNAFWGNTGKLFDHLRPYIMVPFKGRKIAIIGVITPFMDKMAFESNIRGLVFKDPRPILEKLVPQMRKQGADAVILLSHLGIEDDRKIAREVRGIDLILGGHSHTTMTQIEYAEPGHTAIIHPGADMRTLSKIEVSVDHGISPVIKFTPTVLFASEYPEDIEVKTKIDSYLERVREKVSEILGFSQVELNRGIIGGDSSLGGFVADAMREETNADFAFVNIGGIRYPITRGPITYETVFLLQPFANTIDLLTMTGKQVVDIVEKSLSVPFTPINEEDKLYAKENFKLFAEGFKREFHGDYGYLIPSNLLLTYDPALPAMKRLTKITDGSGRALEPEKAYKIALNNFMSLGGDGYSFLLTWKPRQETKLLVRDAVVNFIRKKKIIKEVPPARMFNLKLTTRSCEN